VPGLLRACPRWLGLSPMTLGAVEMSRSELRDLDPPEPMGRLHRPIAHIALVEALSEALEDQGILVDGETFAIQNTHTIFGTMDFSAKSEGLAPVPQSRGHAIGFRAANNQDRALELAVGGRVFVSDSLFFAPGLISLKRKHTVGLDLAAEVAEAVARYKEQTWALRALIKSAQAKALTATAAKVLIFDALAQHKILPMRLLPTIADGFFSPPEEWTDVTEHPNTLWSLHNVFTRQMRTLRPRRRFVETAKLAGMLQVDLT